MFVNIMAHQFDLKEKILKFIFYHRVGRLYK